MGNVKGTRDGYDYRGGGWIQTTGRDAVERYCEKLGVAIHAGALDDPNLTLRFACLEWTEKKCNAYADAGDIMSISKAINVGNAKSSVTPNGMAHRRSWTAKAMKIWGSAANLAPAPAEVVPNEAPVVEATVEAPAPPAKPIVTTVKSSRTVFGVLLAAIGFVLEQGTEFIAEAVSQVVSLAPAKELLEGVGVPAAKIAAVITIAGLAYALFARFDDAKTGSNVKER